MALEHAKTDYASLREYFDRIEALLPLGDGWGDYRFRDALAVDLVKFVVYLSASDGFLAEKEREYLCDLTGYEIDAAQMKDLVKRFQFDDDSVRLDFVSQPLKSYLLCIMADKAFADMGSNENKYADLLNLYKEVGQDIIMVDGAVTQKEVTELVAVLSVLRKVADDAAASGDAAAVPAPEEKDRISFEEAAATDSPAAEMPAEEPAAAPEVMEEPPAAEPSVDPVEELPFDLPEMEDPEEPPVAVEPAAEPQQEPADEPPSEPAIESPMVEAAALVEEAAALMEEPIAEVPVEEAIPEMAIEMPPEEPAAETPTVEPVAEMPAEEAIAEPAMDIPEEEAIPEMAIEIPPEEPAAETPTVEPVAEMPAEEAIAEPPMDIPMEETIPEMAIEMPPEEPAAETPTVEPVAEMPVEEAFAEPAMDIPMEETIPEMAIEIPPEEPAAEMPVEEAIAEPPMDIPMEETIPEMAIEMPPEEPIPEAISEFFHPASSIEAIVAQMRVQEAPAEEPRRTPLEISIGKNGSSYIAILLSTEEVSGLCNIAVPTDVPAMLIGNSVCVANDGQVYSLDLLTGEMHASASDTTVTSWIQQSIRKAAAANTDRIAQSGELRNVYQQLLTLSADPANADALNKSLTEYDCPLCIRGGEAGAAMVADPTGMEHSVAEILLSIDRAV